MKDFIMTLVIGAVASGIIGLFFDESIEISKDIKLVLSLCVIASIIPGAAKELNEQMIKINEYEIDYEYDFEKIRNEYDEYIIERARIEMCSELEKIKSYVGKTIFP